MYLILTVMFFLNIIFPKPNNYTPSIENMRNRLIFHVETVKKP